MTFDKQKKDNIQNEKALQQRDLLKKDKIAKALRENLKKRKAQANARKNS